MLHGILVSVPVAIHTPNSPLAGMLHIQQVHMLVEDYLENQADLCSFHFKLTTARGFFKQVC